LEFDEFINPASVYKSIESNNEVSFRVSSSKIFISPNKFWNEPVIINVNRELADYQNNSISSSLNIVYSTEGKVPDYYIDGVLNEIDTTKIFKVYLYKFPIERNFTDLNIHKKINYYRKVDSDINGHFQFNNIDNDKYIVVASSGNISTPNSIYNHEYSLSKSDYVSSLPMNQKGRNKTKVNLLISNPVQKLKTKDIRMINNNFLEIFYDNNKSDFFYMDDNSVGDSIFFNIEKYNNIEKYYISDYFIINQFVVDSIPPSIESYKINKENIQIDFSEPIFLLKPDSVLAINDSGIFNYVAAKINSYNQIEAEYSFMDDDTLFVNGSNIMDFNNNTFSSEMVGVSLGKRTRLIGGSVLGEIDYSGDKELVVKLFSPSDAGYLITTSNNKFSFDYIPEGKYKIIVFEKIVDFSDEYYSGTIIPYNRAANFLIYDNILEVRNHWVIKDIKLIFEE
jgi:hypothetical protein